MFIDAQLTFFNHLFFQHPWNHVLPDIRRPTPSTPAHSSTAIWGARWLCPRASRRRSWEARPTDIRKGPHSTRPVGGQHHVAANAKTKCWKDWKKHNEGPGVIDHGEGSWHFLGCYRMLEETTDKRRKPLTKGTVPLQAWWGNEAFISSLDVSKVVGLHELGDWSKCTCRATFQVFNYCSFIHACVHSFIHSFMYYLCLSFVLSLFLSLIN